MLLFLFVGAAMWVLRAPKPEETADQAAGQYTFPDTSRIELNLTNYKVC